MPSFRAFLPFICPILKESITIPATREEITQLWDLKNLAGMAAIIYNQYYKPSFITFNNNLIKAMSFQIYADDTKTNPIKAVNGVQDLISTWDTHNLWAQILPDHFWSAVLLHSLNSHALFRDVLQKTQESRPALWTPTNIHIYFYLRSESPI